MAEYEATVMAYMPAKNLRVWQTDRECYVLDDKTGETVRTLHLTTPHDPGPSAFWAPWSVLESDLWKELEKDKKVVRTGKRLSLPGSYAVGVRVRQYGEGPAATECKECGAPLSVPTMRESE